MADGIRTVDKKEDRDAGGKSPRRWTERAIVILGLAVWPLFVGAASLVFAEAPGFLRFFGQIFSIAIMVWYVSATRRRSLCEGDPAAWRRGWQLLALIWLIGWFVVLCDLPHLLWYAHRRYVEREASPLPELGAYVSCRDGDWTVMSFDPTLNDERLSQWSPHLLRLRVVGLNLSNSQITDRGIESLKGMRSLKCLYLTHTAITDDALRYVADFSDLYALEIQGTRVTDTGLQQLKGLKHLGTVDVWDTPVTEAGAKALKASIPGLFVRWGGKNDARRAPSPLSNQDGRPGAGKADGTVFPWEVEKGAETAPVKGDKE